MKERYTTENMERVIKTKFVFFTGKGGVGKTSLAASTAVSLAQLGRRVLLVSTDPASNLNETLGTPLTGTASQVPGAAGLMALNIDPEASAEAYRARVIAPMLGQASKLEIAGLREQLSGACTVEIAAFDEFSALLADESMSKDFDLIIFDTAPTGHTLRLLSLPQAWTGFFKSNERGASCLGPHSALKTQADRFARALANLRDPNLTQLVLVTKPETSAIAEAARTSLDLRDMGLSQQILIVNGIFTASDSQDALAKSLAAKSLVALRDLPPILRELPVYSVPLMPFNTVGLQALRDLVAPIPRLQGLSASSEQGLAMLKPSLSLQVMAHELATQQRGLVMVMGKGGVGKTTIAAALAVAIAKSGHPVHLSTTDPAAHLAQTIESVLPNLTISRIDPKKETADYCQKILDAKGKTLDSDGIAMLKEDLASPCTEEVAVFHAFARTVFEARRGIVILDTAPTGHTLLLLDAAGSYHREILKKYEESSAGNLRTPLMMLQDSSFAKILLVTLAEATPITEAAALQSDLRRAGIEPYGWVVNRSLAASRTSDDLLRHRAVNEAEQMQRINRGLAKRLAILPLLEEEPIGPDKLLQLLRTEAK